MEYPDWVNTRVQREVVFRLLTDYGFYCRGLVTVPGIGLVPEPDQPMDDPATNLALKTVTLARRLGLKLNEGQETFEGAHRAVRLVAAAIDVLWYEELDKVVGSVSELLTKAGAANYEREEWAI